MNIYKTKMYLSKVNEVCFIEYIDFIMIYWTILILDTSRDVFKNILYVGLKIMKLINKYLKNDKYLIIDIYIIIDHV